MTTRPRILAAIAVAGSVLIAGGIASHPAAARVAADDPTATPTLTITPTDTPVSGTPAATDTPGFAGDTPTPVAGSPTATHIAVKPIVHNPTPIPAVRKHITLPKAVVVEVATKVKATGLGQQQAFLLANKYVPQLFVVAPTFVPKGYTLQMIHVDPQQDQQTPPAASLQYIPKGLSKVSGTFPSFYVNKQVGVTPIVFPGLKPQTVIINKGSHGVGVVMGTLVDLKPKNGYETVHITWTRVTIGYDVSSTIGLSKLSIKDLLAVAATVQ